MFINELMLVYSAWTFKKIEEEVWSKKEGQVRGLNRNVAVAAGE
jgi:hypothetical protein